MKWTAAVASGLYGWGVVAGIIGFFPRVPWAFMEHLLLIAAMGAVVWSQDKVIADMERWLSHLDRERKKKWEKLACYGLWLWWFPVILAFMPNMD